MWDPTKDIETRHLPNGLTVHASQWADRAWEAVGIIIHSGGACDPSDKTGTAHFVEHMVNENACIPGPKIDEFIESVGGSVMRGSTDLRATKYTFYVPADRAILARVLSIFGSMLVTARLERNLERERAVIMGEFRDNYDEPLGLTLHPYQRRAKALYAGTPYADRLHTIGSMESISAIRAEDLQAFYDRYYVPANTSIVAVGGMSVQEIADLISESPLGMEKLGDRAPLPIPVEPVIPSTNGEIVRLSDFGRSGGYGSYGCRTVIPASVPSGAVHLCSNMLDVVLTEEAREKRAWTYGIGSGSEEMGYFHGLSVKCSSLAPQGMDGIDSLVRDCIDRCAADRSLFERLRSDVVCRWRLLDSTGRQFVHTTLDDLSRYQRTRPLSEMINSCENLAFEDIRTVFSYFSEDRMYTIKELP